MAQAQYAPAANQVGTTAISKDSTIIINWATEVIETNIGLMDIANSSGGNVNFGFPADALGVAEGSSTEIFSLGDNGFITLGFENPIKNGIGNDFAVFENSFSDDFLELAHVEVSTDGIRFVRFPSVSLTPTNTQTSSFGNTDPTKLYNLAGKYRQGFGTPFDLEDITDSTDINLDSINYVRVIDVVGTLNTNFCSYDSQGHKINDPYPTAFASGGFDLDGIAVLNENKFVGINEIESNSYQIYPNPSNETVNIYTKTNCEVDIISINGQFTQHYSLLKNEEVQINYLKNGLYLVYFTTNKKTFIKKLIVNQ